MDKTQWNNIFKEISNKIYHLKNDLNNINIDIKKMNEIKFDNIKEENKKFKKCLKPMFKWCGGKRREFAYIYKFLPNMNEVDTYIEPFIGGGALYFSLNHNKNIINDIHPEVTNFYEVSKTNLSDIYNNLNEWKNEEKEYYRIRDELDCNTNILKASRFYYLRKTCFRGMLRYNSKGKFNIPFGRYKTYNLNEIDPNKNLFKRYEEILNNTIIENRDFSHLFEEYNSPDNFMFLDPPYDSSFQNYGFDDFNEIQQRKLSKLFKETIIKCMIVISETPLIKELYSGNDTNGNPYIKGFYPKKYGFKIKENRIGNEINKNHLIITNYSNLN